MLELVQLFAQFGQGGGVEMVGLDEVVERVSCAEHRSGFLGLVVNVTAEWVCHLWPRSRFGSRGSDGIGEEERICLDSRVTLVNDDPQGKCPRSVLTPGLRV